MARVSSARAAPTRSIRAGFQLAAIETPVGKEVVGPSMRPTSGWLERTPCGPSVMTRLGSPRRSIGTVCQESGPDSREIFSRRVSCLRSASTCSSTKQLVVSVGHVDFLLRSDTSYFTAEP